MCYHILQYSISYLLFYDFKFSFDSNLFILSYYRIPETKSAWEEKEEKVEEQSEEELCSDNDTTVVEEDTSLEVCLIYIIL